MNQDINSEFEFSRCPMSCANGDRFVLTARDRINDFPGDFTLVECKGCGLIRTDPRPKKKEIFRYYPDDYAPYLNTRSNQSGHGLRYNFTATLRGWIGANPYVLPPKMPRGSLLEIGCASGSFLHSMAQKGWSVTGVEPSPTAAEEASNLGHKVFNCQIEDMPKFEGQFDLVVGWMVVEHLHDPAGALTQVSNYTSDDGWLVISVPNAGSIERRFFGEDWYALHLPCHLYHFTPTTIRMLLEHSGWRVERVIHQKTLSNLLHSLRLKYERERPASFAAKFWGKAARNSAWLNAIFFPLVLLMAITGQTGRMTVWARKK